MAQRILVVDAGGVARLVKNDRLFVVDAGGVARKLKRMFVIDAGGVARQVYQNAIYYAGGGGPYDDTDGFAIGSAVVTVSFGGAGGLSVVGQTSGTLESANWVTPTSLAPGAYTIRANLNSGTAATNGTAHNTDLALSGGTRNWQWLRASPGSTVANVTFVLKDGGGNIVAQSPATPISCNV